MELQQKPDTAKDQADTSASRLEAKSKLFDKEFRLFVSQARETIQSRYASSIALGNIPPMMVRLDKYYNVYSKMDAAEHFRYFEGLYGRKRKEILSWLKDDRWIRTGGIEIYFGDGIKAASELEEKRKEIRIMLSDIFLVAYDLRDQAEKAIEGLDDDMVEDNKDLIRPKILMLHLMRIFYHLNDKTDRKQLGDIVTQVEVDLGMTKRTVDEAVNMAQMAQAAATTPAATGGLSSLFTMATSMMEKMGYKPPEGMKPPSENEITSVINNVFGNETTQNAIQGMLSSLQNCQDFGSAMQTVVQNVTDPKTMDAIQQSVSQTAQFAAATPSTQPSPSEAPQPSPQ